MSDYRTREEQAEQRGRALIELVRPHLPITLPPLNIAKSWALVGPGLIARMVGTLEAVFALRPLDRVADPMILGRSLYDHAVTFAWLAADPGEERLERFQKADLCRRLQVDDDCRKLTYEGIAIEIMPPEARANFERQLAELRQVKNLPDLADWLRARIGTGRGRSRP